MRHGGTGLLHVVHASIGAPLKLSVEHHGKLKAMHAHCGDGAFFNADLLRLLLRYKHLGGSGFQASLGGGAPEVRPRDNLPNRSDYMENIQ